MSAKRFDCKAAKRIRKAWKRNELTCVPDCDPAYRALLQPLIDQCDFLLDFITLVSPFLELLPGSAAAVLAAQELIQAIKDQAVAKLAEECGP